jgi:hypothetical protein
MVGGLKRLFSNLAFGITIPNTFNLVLMGVNQCLIASHGEDLFCGYSSDFGQGRAVSSQQKGIFSVGVLPS